MNKKQLKYFHSSDKQDWETPQFIFDVLDAEFGFTLDACATPENAKCEKYFTPEDDGLSQEWNGEIVFCNPQYKHRAWRVSPNMRGVILHGE